MIQQAQTFCIQSYDRLRMKSSALKGSTYKCHLLV